MRTPFIKGLDLSQRYSDEAVQPILDRHFPGLRYSTARLDGGSDVLGFDTPQSRDHDWGPRLKLFLSAADKAKSGEEVMHVLGRELPLEFCGYPTNFEPFEDGSLGMVRVSQAPVAPYITLHTVPGYFKTYLGYDVAKPLSPVDWLTFPEQCLRTIRSGRIFHDGLGRLSEVQKRLHYYPDDLWLYLLAAQWRRIDQEEPFVGRCGDVGDEAGSRLVAARQIHHIMRLSFLMEKQFGPYLKWFGTAFAQLEHAARLTPLFEAVWGAPEWQERQEALSRVYEYMARWHNELDITPPLPATVSNFHNRPYLVIHSGRYVEAIRARIQDESVRLLPAHLGAIDQFVDSTDVLTNPRRIARLKQVYSGTELPPGTS